MALSTNERKEYSAEQLAELDRAADVEKFVDPSAEEKEGKTKEETDALRQDNVDKLKALSADELKTRINIDSFSDVITYSSDDNYTAQQKSDIAEVIKNNNRTNMISKIAEKLANAAAMRADGENESTIKSVLQS